MWSQLLFHILSLTPPEIQTRVSFSFVLWVKRAIQSISSWNLKIMNDIFYVCQADRYSFWNICRGMVRRLIAQYFIMLARKLTLNCETTDCTKFHFESLLNISHIWRGKWGILATFSIWFSLLAFSIHCVIYGIH